MKSRLATDKKTEPPLGRLSARCRQTPEATRSIALLTVKAI